MFRPLGSFIPTAVFADIGLFFDKQQLHQFSLASPRANGIFKSHRMMAYKKITINRVNYKFSIGLEDSNIDDTKRKIHIDTEKEDMTEKMAILLSTCYSIDEFLWHVQSYNNNKWNYFMINEKLIELMLKIEIKKMFLRYCSISAPLPLFLKFLHRSRNNLTLQFVKLPSELVSNKTLRLISDFHILPMDGTNLVVDVNDELLEGYNTSFDIYDFITKFTINGISAFTRKIGHRPISFGFLASDQLQDAIDFERKYPGHEDSTWLNSINGQKTLNFYEIGMNHSATFFINLNTENTDQFGMLPFPNHLFGMVAQESFVKFDKICSIPVKPLPYSQYQMDSLSLKYNAYDVFDCNYNIRGENRDVVLERNSLNLKDAQTIIVEILRNCTSIEKLGLYGIKLDEEFYRLLKPIANNIRVTSQWIIESALEPESLREIQAAQTGLFGNVKLEFPERMEE